MGVSGKRRVATTSPVRAEPSFTFHPNHGHLTGYPVLGYLVWLMLF